MYAVLTVVLFVKLTLIVYISCRRSRDITEAQWVSSDRFYSSDNSAKSDDNLKELSTQRKRVGSVYGIESFSTTDSYL